MSASFQTEFSLRVAVCAWCKPKKRRAELGSGLGAISHGICLHHLKQLRMSLQMKKQTGSLGETVQMRRRRTTFDHPELDYTVHS